MRVPKLSGREGEIYQQAAADLPSESEKRAAVARETAKFFGQLAASAPAARAHAPRNRGKRRRPMPVAGRRRPRRGRDPFARRAVRAMPTGLSGSLPRGSRAPPGVRLRAGRGPPCTRSRPRALQGWRANAAPRACAAPASYEGACAARSSPMAAGWARTGRCSGRARPVRRTVFAGGTLRRSLSRGPRGRRDAAPPVSACCARDRSTCRWQLLGVLAMPRRFAVADYPAGGGPIIPAVLACACNGRDSCSRIADAARVGRCC